MLRSESLPRQGVFLAEFDGPRERELKVTVVAGVQTQAAMASKGKGLTDS